MIISANQIREAIDWWSGELALKLLSESVWKVVYSDDEHDSYSVTFQSKADAENFIKFNYMQDRYEPSGFEVIDGPFQTDEK